MEYKIRVEKEFKYIEVGTGTPLMLLHGLFGALSNFKSIINTFSKEYKVVVPMLPLFDLEVADSTIDGLLDYVQKFVAYKEYNQFHLLGNSLGGHLCLLYTLQNQSKVKTLTLTGSSGLFENSLGDSYPKKGDYDYVKTKTEYTFYNPNTASKELVDEVFEIVNNREKAIRVLYIARSAIRHNVKDQLHTIHIPVNLIWGREDKITPLFAGEEFHKLLPNSTLHVIDQCAHVPMMEHPETFDKLLLEFLKKHD